MQRNSIVIVLAVLYLLIPLAAQGDQPAASALYYRAFHVETAEGDWTRAATLYERVMATENASPGVRARARRRLDHCRKMLGKPGAGTPQEEGAARAPRPKDHLAVFNPGNSCRACHVPHNPNKAPPLWSKRAEDRMAFEDPAATSLLCAGCHDGYLEAPCSCAVSVRGNRHPVGMIYKGPGAGEGPDDLPLFNRTMACSTCHYSHQTPKGAGAPFLRVAHKGGMYESALCTKCHGQPEEPPRLHPSPPARTRIVHLASYVSHGGSEYPEPDLVTVPSDRGLGATGPASPYGLAIQGSRLLLGDRDASAVLAFDLTSGQPRGRIGADVLRNPTNLGAGPKGGLFVADGAGSVALFDPAGRHLRALAAPGAHAPHGLAISAEEVFVSRPRGQRIDVYQRQGGQHLRTLDLSGKPSAGKELPAAWPLDLALDPDGNLLASDTRRLLIQRLSPTGERLQVIGSEYLGRPRGVACDRAGRVYVVDAAWSDVRIFDPQGKLLLFFGGPADRGGGRLHHPAQVVLDYDHVDLFKDRVPEGLEIEYLVAVTNQVGARKVELYGFVKGPHVVEAAPEKPRKPAKKLLPDPLQKGDPKALKPKSAHPLYRSMSCKSCHRPAESGDGLMLEGSAKLWKRCASCHGKGKEHAPGHTRQEMQCKHVVHGDCRTCHVPHTSKHAQLLKKPAPAICLECHEK